MYSAAGSSSRLRDLLTCRRRAPAAKSGGSHSTASYEALRKHAEQLSDEQKATFRRMAWWSSAETKMGGKVFVLAPRGPDGDTECSIDMWSLLAYSVSQMHDHVVERGELFAVVWAQFSDQRVWPWGSLAFKRHLHPKYSRYLDSVHVVHPSWTVRVLRLCLWPFASDEFWDLFQCHERVEFLEPDISLRKLALPKDIYDYDKFLDTQADEMSKNAAKQMNGRGGFGGSMFSGLDKQNENDSEKFKEQMENVQKLMEEKGYGKKSN